MFTKVKYDEKLIKQATKVFPQWKELHDNMRSGKTQPVLDMIHDQVGFVVDEDDVIRAFRNNKQDKLLDLAKKSRDVRELYQKVFLFLDKQETKVAVKHGYDDCF